jgi:hypothetical protein
VETAEVVGYEGGLRGADEVLFTGETGVELVGYTGGVGSDDVELRIAELLEELVDAVELTTTELLVG